MPFWQAPLPSGDEDAGVERTLDDHELGDEPLGPLVRWLDDATAAGELLPHAMALATASSDGWPSVRMVLLERVDERGVWRLVP